jgi:hypothetical protein
MIYPTTSNFKGVINPQTSLEGYHLEPPQISNSSVGSLQNPQSLRCQAPWLRRNHVCWEVSECCWAAPSANLRIKKWRLNHQQWSFNLVQRGVGNVVPKKRYEQVWIQAGVSNDQCAGCIVLTHTPSVDFYVFFWWTAKKHQLDFYGGQWWSVNLGCWETWKSRHSDHPLHQEILS